MNSAFSETLLQLLWKTPGRYLQAEPLLTDGSKVIIRNPGTHNQHRGGPDFLGAEIILDGLLLKGDIEIHQSAGDWKKHGHTDDPRYSSVILHIVMDDDDLPFPNIPTLALRSNLLFDEKVFWNKLFEERYARAPELPCFPHNLAVRMKQKRALIGSMADLRLEELVKRFECDSKDNLHDLVYEHILDALGFSQNREPMKALSQLLPRKYLQGIAKNEQAQNLPTLFQALFFGVSGLLEQPQAIYSAQVNDYLLDLNAKWQELQISYPIGETLTKGDWAFFRIRPVNSPYRRVALAASLAVRYFSRKEFSVLDDIVFADGNNWWLTRTSYKSELKEAYSLLGDERLKAIEINVLLPARIALLRLKASDGATTVSEKSLTKEWMETPSASSATYCQTIEQELLEGESIQSTAHEQGALYLHRNYCTQLRCDECPVGKGVMEQTGMTFPGRVSYLGK